VARRVLVIAAAAAAVLASAPPGGAAAASLPGCAEPESAGGDWPSYGHDAANTRFQPDEKVISPGDVPTLTTAWTFSAVKAGGEGDFTGTPVVEDGCMYIASTRGWVFAVNADTGKLVWKAKVPLTGGVNSSVAVAQRELPKAAFRYRRCGKIKSKRKRRRCVRARRRAKSRWKRKKAPTAGTVYVAVTRTQKGSGCTGGDACIGPYIAAFDQATGKLAFASQSLDTQPGADVYGSPVIYDGVLLIGTSGGSAELGDEADRYAFQGSMNLVDANDGRMLRKQWTIHPPKQPDDLYAGAGIWSTPAIDVEDKVAYVGTANPFKPQAEHKYADSIVKFDLDRSSPTFGQIVGSYKGTIDEYVPAFSQLPCYDFPSNNPPYYPQGIGSCGDTDLDFGASPNLFKDASGRKLVGAGQKSGVYHVIDARTMKPVWTQIVGPPSSVGGIVGSTAYDGKAVYGPVTVPGYVWSLDGAKGSYRWVGPIADGAHWGPPVAAANGVVYSVDFSGFLDAFDARNGVQLAKRPLLLGSQNPESLSWAGVSIARNTVYAAIGVLGLADGFVTALRRGGPADVANDVSETGVGGNGGGGGGGGGGQAGPSVVAAPGAASTGYATPAMTTQKGGPLTFLNLDNVQHDVVSVQKGPDGNPLFRSKLIGLAETAPVEGLDKVQSGQTYEFYCSVHPGMRGNLIVQ
jgi:polyvinyl alcohol dehydrogenase (cytochrome)